MGHSNGSFEYTDLRYFTKVEIKGLPDEKISQIGIDEILAI
jgi:hypothetical protein